MSRGSIVATTGDGINDSPALALVDIGIVISLAKATFKKMLQNLVWATAYNVFAVPLAAGVLYKLGILLIPTAGTEFMSLSILIVAINAKILKMET